MRRRERARLRLKFEELVFKEEIMWGAKGKSGLGTKRIAKLFHEVVNG